MSKKFKMALHFLGTGDAFSRHPNNAYFRPDEDTLVFIDLDARNFMRAKREIERKIPRRIFVLITHMHNDHVSGIPTLAEWLRYKCADYSDSLYICAPEKILVYMAKELFEYRNLTDDMVTFVTVESMCREEKSWLISAIPTLHVEGHFEGLCYGYLLSIGFLRVLYSGDTKTLDPFFPISCDEFYCDMSNYSGLDRPHLSWELDKEALCKKSRDCDVYVMHMSKEVRERLQEEIEEAGLFIAKA